MWPTNTSFVDLLRNFEVSFPLPNDDRFETDNDFGFDKPNSQFSEDSVNESLSDVGDDSDDVGEPPIANFMNDIGDVGDDDVADFQDNVHLDFWNESENKIRLGMQFESKAQVKKAVTLWSIAQNREFKVCESKSSFWIAKCKTLGCEIESSSTPHCAWYVRAMKKKNHHMWKITRWVDAHNCFGSCIGNNNINLNSATIVSYIIHSVEKDIDYPVKQIQAYIKNSLNVDVSYWKAWHVCYYSWCLLYDENRRWGLLTTNISESMNNALRGARQLPIRACIDLTFNRTVQLFRKYSDAAMNCNTPLPSRMWRLFVKHDTHAQSNTLSEFDYNEGIYRIVTKLRLNESGGNTHTVSYFQHMCTCSMWQMERFPCSHALTVCRVRGDNPLTIVNTVYTTMTYKQQYNFGFSPLPHVDYWLEADWKIEGDFSKRSVGRGRRSVNQFRNEMDVRHPDEPRRCGLCHQTGHNRRNCSSSQPRFNTM